MRLYSKIKYIMFTGAILLLSACSSGSGDAGDTGGGSGSSDWGSMNWDSDNWK